MSSLASRSGDVARTQAYTGQGWKDLLPMAPDVKESFKLGKELMGEGFGWTRLGSCDESGKGLSFTK
jgi:hypothetical protein